METKELRIGNLVEDQDGVHYVIYAISRNSVIVDPPFGCFDISEISPIPLTEEWMVKFGKIEWIYKDIGGIFYWFNGEKKYLKFVHLLQNTYFCIEQKELLCVNI